MATMLPARQNNDPGLPVRIIVTAEPRHGKTVPPLEAADVTVKEGRDKRPVDGLTPLGPGSYHPVDVIDRRFFARHVRYRNPGAEAVCERAAAANVRSRGLYDERHGPNGGEFHQRPRGSREFDTPVARCRRIGCRPYDSLTDAVKKWPTTPADRKEIIMISSGVENLGGGFDPENPYVNAGIDSAVKAGVIVYTIYNPSAGHEGHVFWRNTWGQSFLSELSDATGGEAYIIGFGSPVSFQPFLEEIMEAQRHQYVLTFLAKAENKSSFQQIKASVMEKDASLAAPTKVYVRAGL